MKTLILPALAEIMDAAPPRKIALRIRNLVGEIKEVSEVEKCYVREMGFDYYADLHIKVNGSLGVLS